MTGPWSIRRCNRHDDRSARGARLPAAVAALSRSRTKGGRHRGGRLHRPPGRLHGPNGRGPPPTFGSGGSDSDTNDPKVGGEAPDRCRAGRGGGRVGGVGSGVERGGAVAGAVGERE